MLTRRHIRVKVMQSLYAFEQSGNQNLNTEEKFLRSSMENMYDLFLLQLDLLVQLKKTAEDYLEKSQRKYLATDEDQHPNLKFIQNRVIEAIETSSPLTEKIEDRKLTHWSKDHEYVSMLWSDIRESDLYHAYLQTRTSSLKEDKDFLIAIFKEVIAPNEKLYEYLEDRKLTWMDDLPLINTAVLKLLRKVKPGEKDLKVPKLFKSLEDREFALELFRKTLLNQTTFEESIAGKTPKWDKDRIAEIDKVLLQMAICEFLKFPSIPVKVTINEYLEVAKEYSTPKSSIFINGVLDRLSKEFQESKKLNKIGRGLM